MTPDDRIERSVDLRVLVVASDPLARGGLAALVDGRGGVVVAGQAPADGDLASAAATYEADVVVWDLGSDVGEAIEELSGASRDLPPVVALLGETALAAQAWGAGARGLLHRDVTSARLVAALYVVVEGSSVLDDAFADALVRRAEPAAGPVEPLTPRELEVLRLLAEGYANKAVAAELEVSENTVKFHVNAILGKLSAQSRTEAVTRATRLGLIPL